MEGGCGSLDSQNRSLLFTRRAAVSSIRNSSDLSLQPVSLRKQMFRCDTILTPNSKNNISKTFNKNLELKKLKQNRYYLIFPGIPNGR